MEKQKDNSLKRRTQQSQHYYALRNIYLHLEDGKIKPQKAPKTPFSSC